MRKFNKQVNRGHYTDEGFNPLRVDSFAHQIREIAFSGCKNILEIGVGRNLLKHLLSCFQDIQHTGVDIAADLEPDIIASVTSMPFEDSQFELTICCQVLEHLLFDDFIHALHEIRRVTGKKVILSLPDQRKRLGFAICLPRLQWVEFDINYQLHQSKEKDKLHEWEIGYNGTPYKKVKRAILDAGFKIEKTYRLEKHAWHCFFVLDTNK